MDFGQLSPERAQHLDHLCDCLEAGWRAGRRPRIEDHLAELPAAEMTTVLDMLLATELDLRSAMGERPVPGEYHARFPGHAELIDSVFARQAHPDRGSADGSRPPGRGERTDRLIPTAPPDKRDGARPQPTPELHGQRLEFVVEAGSRPITIQALLSTRLGRLAWLIAPLFVALIVLVDLPKFRTPRPEVASDGLAYICSHLAMVVVAVAVGLGLKIWPGASPFRLRMVEVILFGALCAEFSWIEWHELHDPVTRTLKDVSGIAASAASLGWVVIIAFYGIFIPNDWRRCAVAVILIALCPLVTAFAASVTTESVRWFVFGPFLVYLSLWMLVAAAIVIFGARGVDILRQEVTEARQLGQYDLRRRLSSGGMGEIYLAVHVLLRRPCVIKLIRPERAGDPVYIRRFEREVRAMASLNHWNIVQIFDYGITEDDTLYCVMEYLPGLNLQEMVQRDGPLPPGRVVSFLRQICSALREAHSIQLIHRDIKPSNIMACKWGSLSDVIKLLDFGLVRQISAADDLVADPVDARAIDVGMTVDAGRGGITGTPHYMSPEQTYSNHRVDERSDIYSVGALAYFLLTGQPPFLRSNLKAVLAAHRHENVEPPSRLSPGLPADLEAVALTCLTKNPDGRFPNVGALEDALVACQCAGLWTSELANDWWGRNFASGLGESELATAFGANGAVTRGTVSCILDSSEPADHRRTSEPLGGS